jgi:hypothetical protein
MTIAALTARNEIPTVSTANNFKPTPSAAMALLP